mgnify:CR=1 FL=1
MRIIIDVMSGDNAPGELVRGAVRSRDELGVSVVMVGHRETIEQIAADDGLNLSDIEIVDTDVVIDMEDPALSVVRDKNRSSMAIGLHMLANGEGDAFVSAGNTGALLAGAPDATLDALAAAGVPASVVRAAADATPSAAPP